MDYEQEGRAFHYINVIEDRAALKRMLEYSKGVREVPVIVEGDKISIGYKGGS